MGDMLCSQQGVSVMNMNAVNRAKNAAYEAAYDDRDSRGVGRRAANIRRKKAAVRTDRRANKAILAYKVQGD